jgi:hypothetical protein
METPAGGLTALQSFISSLNASPDPNAIFTSERADDAQYLPISHVQMKLDEKYIGLWNFELKTWEIVGNEIAGTGILEVFHPVARIWIRRSGAAGVPLGNMAQCLPHLSSEVEKNAAKQLGKMFGRDLNRKLEDHFGTNKPAEEPDKNSSDDLLEAIIKEYEQKKEMVAAEDQVHIQRIIDEKQVPNYPKVVTHLAQIGEMPH